MVFAYTPGPPTDPAAERGVLLIHPRKPETLRKLVQEAGRNPDAIQVTALVEPRDGGPSVEELKRYRDAGASRVIVFSQQMGTEAADGKALALIKQLAPVVERAQKV